MNSQKDADSVYVRESEFGPQLVLDYGVHGTVVNMTERDAERAEQALRMRRLKIAADAQTRPCRYSEGRVETRQQCGCESCQLDLAE